MALTKIYDSWLFGYYEKNDLEWTKRRSKPHNYSYALDVWFAKTILNIATKGLSTPSIIDPCCGIGTILIEGRAMNLNIIGNELNTEVSEKCNDNLAYFNFEANTTNQDMTTLVGHYDVAIIDLPYGQFSLTTNDIQKSIIKKSRELANRVVFITKDDMSDIFKDSGFIIKECCEVRKTNVFARYLTICE
jgi:tRNA G10  N-methylase Trm11